MNYTRVMPRKNNTPKTVRQTFRKPICDTKRSFKSEAEALKSADMQNLIGFRDDISAYRCSDCDQWHLTRSK